MTQFLLSVWSDGEYPAPEPEAMEQMFAQVDAFNAELQASGAWVFGGGLHPASAATVVRSSAGGVSMTHGPYAESKEQMGGFWVVNGCGRGRGAGLGGQGRGGLYGTRRGSPLPR